MLELGWKLRRMGGGAFRLIDLMTESIVEFLDKWFESDQLKATLAYYGSIGTFKISADRRTIRSSSSML